MVRQANVASGHDSLVLPLPPPPLSNSTLKFSHEWSESRVPWLEQASPLTDDVVGEQPPQALYLTTSDASQNSEDQIEMSVLEIDPASSDPMAIHWVLGKDPETVGY
jgi:hypothetical protein